MCDVFRHKVVQCLLKWERDLRYYSKPAATWTPERYYLWSPKSPSAQPTAAPPPQKIAWEDDDVSFNSAGLPHLTQLTKLLIGSRSRVKSDRFAIFSKVTAVNCILSSQEFKNPEVLRGITVPSGRTTQLGETEAARIFFFFWPPLALKTFKWENLNGSLGAGRNAEEAVGRKCERFFHRDVFLWWMAEILEEASCCDFTLFSTRL